MLWKVTVYTEKLHPLTGAREEKRAVEIYDDIYAPDVERAEEHAESRFLDDNSIVGEYALSSEAEPFNQEY